MPLDGVRDVGKAKGDPGGIVHKADAAPVIEQNGAVFASPEEGEGKGRLHPGGHGTLAAVVARRDDHVTIRVFH